MTILCFRDQDDDVSAAPVSRLPMVDSDVTLLNQVLEHVRASCHYVNQQLLLEELHRTRMCNTLLVAEADEDVKWTSTGGRRPSTHHSKNISMSGQLAVRLLW